MTPAGGPAGHTRMSTVAYFCMEFGLHEEFPIYAGGLGILAGDFIKSAHDLGRPVVGVGLRWARGYSRQRLGPDGIPVDEFPEYPADFLDDTGARVRVRVKQREVEARVWRVERWGNVPLFLLEPVAEQDRWITRRLYEPSIDARVAQEILLGVGGVRALRKLGLDIATHHFNEGHAVFAGIEMVAERMSEGVPFHEAWAHVRRQIVFTTHTPIPAGNEVHPLDELRRLGACCELVDWEMEQLGGSPFNMTVAGLRLSRKANAVSALHGEVSRAMWRDVEGASPILAITNGVHVPTWQDARIREARGSALGLRETHQTLKCELLAAVMARTGVTLHPDVLTIGFARRAASYKRSDLIFRDRARIEPLLADRRLQLVFAGKNHPDDAEGRRIVANLVAMAHRYPQAVVFVPDYDMGLARLLTRGADVWLNNPVRPLEACGTSGMKAALNGVLNFSVLDGWWPEACQHGRNGWAIGDGDEGPTERDRHDLEALLATLEGDILPAYADHHRWVAMMEASIATVEERFSSDRMVNEYFERLYPRDDPRDDSP
jgi:starch phosphorylase